MAVLPGGVNSGNRYVGEPYSFTTADGAWVQDADGRRYLDYHAAFGAILLGHNAPQINAAIEAALHRNLDLVGIGVTEPEIALAERVTQVIPSAEMMICTTSGSEATFHAVRLSRAVTGRRLLVKFQGGFHGWHDAVARNVISPPDRAYGRDPLSAGILDEVVDATLIAEFNDLESVRALFDRHPDQIAAVILEPIPHNVGALVPTQEFVEGLRELTRDRGALLVFDEVITGFRHALGGYQEICGVTPDLTSFGKGMANGFPIGGLAGPTELMTRFDGVTGDVLHAGTFNGHPLACAAAIATIDYLRGHPDFYDRTHKLGERMRDGLRDIVDDLGLRATVAGYGGVFLLYFTDGPILGYRDLLRNNTAAYQAFHRRMTEAGHLMLPIALKRNHISGAHTEEDITATLEAAGRVLHGMRRDGLTD
jgi:glutamate-1-semialdehyde 2,1-aminomutase